MNINLIKIFSSDILRGVLSENRKNIYLIVAISIITSITDLIFIGIASIGISYIIYDAPNVLALNNIEIMIIGLITITASILLNWKLNYLQAKTGYLMGGMLSEHIMRRYYSTSAVRGINNSNEVLNLTLNESARSAHAVLTPLLAFGSKVIISFILIFTISLYYGWAVIALASYLFIIIKIYKLAFKGSIAKLGKSVTELAKKRTNLIELQVTNKKEVNIFNIKDSVGELFKEVNISNANTQAQINKINSSSKTILEAFLFLPVFILIGLNYSVNIETYVVVSFLKIAPSMYQAFLNYLAFTANISSIERMIEFEQKMNNYKKHKKIPEVCKDTNVIISTKGIACKIGKRNLDIPAFDIFYNDKVLITGESGSGKSTFIDIISNSLNLDKGDIYQKNNLKLSIASQNPGFISGTVRENFTFFLPDVNLDLAQEYLDKLFQGNGGIILDKHIDVLSGGEKLRISIARAILRNADIYIFDEINSSLDNNNSKKIIELLTNLFVDKAVIMILHKDTNYFVFNKHITFYIDKSATVEYK